MTNEQILNQHAQTFEGIRLIDDTGNEYWLARQLAAVLEYSQYRHFLPVIEKAKEACKNSNQLLDDHIEDVLTMVEIGSGARREIAAMDDSKQSLLAPSFQRSLVIQKPPVLNRCAAIGL